MKLYGVTFTYNESTMIPYVMKYLERMGFDKLIVYDNQSSDNTVELLKKYPFVEIRTLNTGGSKSNQMIIDVKNRVWKEFKNEKDAWMFVSDFDEVIYYPGRLKEYLEEKAKDGYNYLNQEMFETICEHFPDKNKFVHESCDGGVFWGLNGCKMTLFKLDTFKSITYTPGAHIANVVLNDGKELKSLNEGVIKSFHLKWIDREFCLFKKNLAQKRRGVNDIKNGYGIQYMISDDEFKKKWDAMKMNLIKITDYVSSKIMGCDASRRIKHTSSSNNTKDNLQVLSSMYLGVSDIKSNKFNRRVVKKRVWK